MEAAAPGVLPEGATVERISASEAASLVPTVHNNRKVVPGGIFAPAPAPVPAEGPGMPELVRMRTAAVSQGAPAFIGNLRGPVDLGGR